MRFLRRVWAVISARWFIGLVAASALAALIWFYGHWLRIGDFDPFASEFNRLLAILVIFVIWGFTNLWAERRARRADDAFVAELAPSADQIEASAQRSQLARRFTDALTTLKNARFDGERGGRRLYELPWYILIGPPAAGKTTALRYSGLRFPLGDDGWEVQGEGGTRDCDWFFTDEAVLIDTAGRFVTQDSHQPVDHAAWTGFLELLVKHRGRQPINGVIVGISLVELAEMSHDELSAQVRAVRQRLGELNERLGIRFPVYVLFTKCDLIAGFTEFFDDLDESERQQVWGMTFDPLGRGDVPDTLAGFDADYGRLVERLSARVADRLQAERDLSRRQLIFSFPEQVARLRKVAHTFLAQVFEGTRYDPAFALRGVYLSSGTQTGAPIDRLMHDMAAVFGLPRPTVSGLRSTGRSYFLTRLLRDVIFPEASLVASDPRREFRQRWLEAAVYAGAGLAVVVGAGLWWHSFSGNKDRIFAFGSALTSYSEAAQPVATNQIADQNLAGTVPALDVLGDLRAGLSDGEPIALRLGLSQRRPLASHAASAYRHGLDTLMLPRLVTTLEQQIRANLYEPEFLYEALKVYLMLGREATLDPELVQAWMQADWESRLPGPTQAALREHLASHLQALVAEPFAKMQLDGGLVERARYSLRELPLEKRGYLELVGSDRALDLPPWRPSDHAGPHAAQVLTRRSGGDLHTPVPGVFTYEGFHGYVLTELENVAAFIAQDRWVLGSNAELDPVALGRLQQDILRLYYDDYIRHWDELRRDVTLQPLGENLAATVDALRVLSEPDASPMGLLLREMSRQTRLTVPPPEPEEEEGGGSDAAIKAATKVGAKALGKVGSQAKKLARLFPSQGGGGGQGEADLPGWPVEQHFESLHALAEGADGAPPALDGALVEVGQVYERLDQARLSPDPDTELARMGGVTAQLQTLAGRLPQPLGDWVGQVASSSGNVVDQRARAGINRKWQADVAPFCQQALGGRFPFAPAGAADVNMGDFASLFAAGGQIDAFFAEHLSPHVDTSRRPWRSRPGGIPVASGALAQFERAAQIRDALFGGGASFSVSFDLKPVTLDVNATQVRLDVDGQILTYGHGPPIPVAMQWPGPGGGQYVRLSMSPALPGEPAGTTIEGPWAWFRLLAESRLEPTAVPEQHRLTITLGSRHAIFELRAHSIRNPFDLAALRDFRCPTQL